MNAAPIYLDHNGTTPVDPQVTEALLPYLREHFGNPSSSHIYGRNARAGIESARTQVAEMLGCGASEVVFTSGASESNNWVIRSVVEARQSPHIITSRIEHPSVLNTCRALEKRGLCQLTVVGVDRVCRVDPEEIRQALQPNTALVSLMHANNEVGTIQPIAQVSALARQHGVLLHVDAAQSVGKISVKVEELGVDFLSVAGHKFYAPKGVGALFIRSGLQLEPLIYGAGHEGGRRSGTECAPFIVGMGKAAQLATVHLSGHAVMEGLRDRLWSKLEEGTSGGVALNGPARGKLPNTLSVNFRGVTGAQVLSGCPGVAASTGPACHDGVVRLSHVLEAMGVDLELGKGAVRLTLGRGTSEAHIDEAAAQLCAAYARALPARSVRA